MPFNEDALNDYASNQGYPAAPAGLQQTATQMYTGGFGNAYDQIIDEEGYFPVAQTWYTGRNVEGENNGWSTEFWNSMMAQNTALSESGGLNTQFDQKDATGVVTWDHTSEDGKRSYKFGDVYQDGRKVANVYDEFDRDTANLMLSQILYSPEEKVAIFSDSDVSGRLNTEVLATHESNNTEIPKALQALETNADIAQQAEDIAEGKSGLLLQAGVVAGSTATSAAAGAALTSWAGPGALVGAVGGGLFGLGTGLFGAVTNKDELAEAAARAYEITSIANRENGFAAAVGEGVMQWGGFSMQATAPLTNVSHGLVELTSGDVGDGKSAYYAVDKAGESTRPWWAKPLGLGSAVGDSLIQFVSPFNRAVYMGQMGAHVGGAVTSLALSGGEQFDPREGGFDNIFQDDDGNFDWVSGTAGIMNIGIDVVQMTGRYGLFRQAGRQSTAVAGREELIDGAGFRFFRDAEGELQKRATLSLLAPSEQLAAWSVARTARVEAMKAGRVVTVDDFYRASRAMASGDRKLKTALVNGFGEGYEELAQGLLEPIAMDGKIDPWNLLDAAMMGGASGVGMSLGSTFRTPSGDSQMENAAYWLETRRRGGVQPTDEEWRSQWDGATDTEKRVMASRGEADIAQAREALESLARQQAATLLVDPDTVDAAKLVDARRTVVERELAKAGGNRVDRYHVLSGQLDAGRVDKDGTDTASTTPAEAVEASFATIADLLDNRVEGFRQQTGALGDRIAEAQAGDQADPNISQRIAEAQQLLRRTQAAAAVGEGIVDDVAAIMARVYDPSTPAADAVALIARTNDMLAAYYRGQLVIDPVEVEGFTFTADELVTAGQQFTSLLHSREPKLDTGSYLTLMPWVSARHTLERSDNVLAVNTDVLQAINGDFDGDKLRGEYTLILPDERWLQARAGQFFGGSGRELDFAVHTFDEVLVQSVASSLESENPHLKSEARAVIANIRQAITTRYGSLLSPAKLAVVLRELETSMRTGKAEARTDLMNALAREAGEPITDMGRANLTNEWLQISKIVRANLEQFQPAYSKLRAAAAPSATGQVQAFETPPGTKNARKTKAVADAQTLSLFAVGNNLFRKFQKIHFSWYNSATVEAAGATKSDLYEAQQFYAELARGITQSELRATLADDSIAASVLVMLERVVRDAMRDEQIIGRLNPGAAMTILANTQVKNVWMENGEPYTDNVNVSLAQVLLGRALDADRERHFKTFENDEKLQAKHNKLRALTRPPSDENPVTAELAFYEVFKAIPFNDSLSGVNGNLAPQTTPEQWLRVYNALDSEARKRMETEFTSAPEYLDRARKTNLPYTLNEARTGAVTPYRSMLDVLLAVGRSDLTFDPDTEMKNASQAFGGRKGKTNRTAVDNLKNIHSAAREALLTARQGSNRGRKNRELSIDMVRRLFNQNPTVGRALMDMVPDADTNALYEFDPKTNKLYVVPWIYEWFTIEDSKEAAFFFWKNLTIAQWRSTEHTVHEDDGKTPGRSYRKLNSRFQRVLYELAKEPGRLRMEQLLRKMDEVKDIDEFFLWLNRTPGYRSNNQAPLLPFVDDVSDFEADGAGGWVTSHGSSDLRQAITEMLRVTKVFNTQTAMREASAATDTVIRKGLRRARNNDPAATKTDVENLRKFEKAVKLSLQLPRGFAPRAMLALQMGAINGFDAHAHDKGLAIDYVAPLGEFQALMDAFAYVPALERVMESLTAHSVSSLKSNLGDMSRFGGLAMDADGRPVEWEPMTVDEALNMLDDPDASPLALALLTPSALDLANGKLVERTLHDTTLKDLLDGRHLSRLFELDGSDALEKSTTYGMILESRARLTGGNFDFTRYVNSMIIDRMSGLDHIPKPDEQARMRNQANIDAARALQQVGNILATPDLRDSGILDEVRKDLTDMLRNHQQAQLLPGFVDDTGKVLKTWVELMLEDKRAERDEIIDQYGMTYVGDELTRKVDAIMAEWDALEGRINGLLENDMTRAIAERFRITGDAQEDAASRVQIAEYAHSMTSFPYRAPESAMLWTKLVDKMQGGQLPGDEFDWDQLSRSVMGVYLTEQLLNVGPQVTIPAFPMGTDKDPFTASSRYFKYFDTAYTHLVTDILDETSGLSEAAEWFHTMAEQPRVMVDSDHVVNVLTNTIARTDTLGKWTPGQMSHIVEMHQRMDSAGNAAGIPMPGNGPKRLAAISWATKRNAEHVPTPDLLTTIKFSGRRLADGEDRYDEVELTPTGGTEPVQMPVQQLDNRFVSALRVNGTAVDLGKDNLGFAYTQEVSPTGYRYLSLERLKQYLDWVSHQTNTPLSQLEVEVDFFHPDSRPAGQQWMHNIYFDGMSHSLLPDGSESLLASLWSDNGGLIGRDTQRLLDAGKKGLRAIENFIRLDAAAKADAEARWSRDNDFAGMLRAKTKMLMEYDDGALEPAYYNAVHKYVSLHHVIVGTKDGKVAAMTAEEVVQHQAVNGRMAPLPLEAARLVQLSPEVLRTMLGETGDQGVPRYFADEYLLNQDLVDRYEGVTEGMLSRFGEGWLGGRVTIGETSLVNTGQNRTLTVSGVVTPAERNERSDRVAFLNNQSANTRSERSKVQGRDWQAGYLTTLELAIGSISAERSTFDMQALGFPIAPRSPVEAEHTVRLLEAVRGIASPNDYSFGWIVRDAGIPDYPGGALTLESLTETRPVEFHVVKDDLALLELSTFSKPERDIETTWARIDKALVFLASSGATIALGSGNGEGDLRDYAERSLSTLGYAPVQGSRHLYGPREFSQQSQNERAHESTLRETDTFKPNRNTVQFLATDFVGTTENDAVVNPKTLKLRNRRVLNNILPAAVFPTYGLAADDNMDGGIYAQSLARLRKATDPSNTESRARLRLMAGADPKNVLGIDEALDDFHEKINSRASLELEVGDLLRVGDIVPFVNTSGRIILYRHGFKTISEEEIDKLVAEDLSVFLAKSETEPLATANSGVVNEIHNRSSYGRTVVLEMPLQLYGDKIQVELNGMKYILVPPNDRMQAFLDVPVFANGTLVDLLSDLTSADAKEATLGRVNNYRNALAFFQFDFTDDLMKFFFPDDSSKDPAKRLALFTMLRRLQKRRDLEIGSGDAAVLSKANVAIADLVGTFASEQTDLDTAVDWIDRIESDGTVEAQIARAVIIYLLSPHADIDNVIKSAGFSHPDARSDTVETRRVPGLFADLLDNGMGSALHDELIRRFDAQLQSLSNGAGFKLQRNWTTTITSTSGETLEGYLQFGEAHSSGDNPLIDGQAWDASEWASVSPHNAMASGLSIGAKTSHRVLKKTKAFADSMLRKGEEPIDANTLWRMMTTVPDEANYNHLGFMRETAMEMSYRKLSRDDIVGLYHPFDDDTRDTWTADQRAEYDDVRGKVLSRLNLRGNQTQMFDTWVRQQLGRPYQLNDDGFDLSLISGKDAVIIAKQIRNNVRDGLLPVAKAFIPLQMVEHLTTLYMANANRSDGKEWKPRTTTKANGPRAQGWDAWVEVAFGTAWGPNEEGDDSPAGTPEFDYIYRRSVDGIMHGYQNATSKYRYLPVSSDALRQRQLMDPENNRMLISINSDTNTATRDPMLLDAAVADLEEILGGQQLYGPNRDRLPTQAHWWQRKRLDKWKIEEKIPTASRTNARGIRGPGMTFLGHSSTTSPMIRILGNFRVAKSLFNFALILYAPVEAFYRRTIDSFANLLVGEQIGAAGRMQSKLMEMLPSGKIADLAKQFTGGAFYTLDEQKRFQLLVYALSRNAEFKSMIYKDLTYQYPVFAGGIGKWEKRSEKLARTMSVAQDPSYGMLPQDLARVYLSTVLRRMSANGSGSTIYSMDRMLKGMTDDPHWIQKLDLETHNAATSTIGNMRSLKPNVISMGFRGALDPLARNGKPGINTFANLLKMLTVFQNFWTNSLINMAGLQGAADFAAFWFDGRKKSKLTRMLQAGLAGEPFEPTEDEFYDMSETIESIDLADSFIRGGVTHTALFTLGLLANGLGLTGEDEEEKWRRRAAELQGAGFVYDPTAMHNDFRNRDTIFLNNVPGLNSLFQLRDEEGVPIPGADSIAGMAWTTKYFLSPALGMERFFQTGDFDEVVAGFRDAIGAHPIVNEQLWSAGMQTVRDLQLQAKTAEEAGAPVPAMNFLITAVGTLEYMWFENSMINMVYVGTDRYDRDPFILTRIDSDGNQQGDARGNPYQTDVLTPVVDPLTGEISESYVERDANGALVRSFTENRFTAALVGSLWDGLTGGEGGFTGSDMWRRNMAVKIRKIQLTDVPMKQMEANVLAAWQGANTLALQSKLPVATELSEAELTQIYKEQAFDRYDATGEWTEPEVIERQAAQAYAQQGLALMSEIEEASGREFLTDVGRRAIFDGLKAGTVQLGDASMQGVFMTLEQRNVLRDNISRDIVKEGVVAGMTKEQATWRMKRIVFGVGTEEGTPKLIDLIYTDQIPWTDTLEYNQLNTTYTMGPNGQPMSTGITRDGFFGAIGLKPFQAMWGAQQGLKLDATGNVVDPAAGINTGLRGLEARPESWEIPSIEDITKKGLEDVLKAIENLDLTPSTPNKPDSSGSGSGWMNFGGYGGGGGGGYSGSSYGPTLYYNKMYSLPNRTIPYGSNIPYVNVSNPFIRRADVRRERVWSERGRLKQWQ